MKNQGYFGGLQISSNSLTVSKFQRTNTNFERIIQFLWVLTSSNRVVALCCLYIWWRFQKYQGKEHFRPIYFSNPCRSYRDEWIPKRSKITFKLDKILSKNFWKKKIKKYFLVVEKSTPKNEADLQNQWCAPWWSDGFGGRPHLWEWISRWPKNIFHVFQKFFESI